MVILDRDWLRGREIERLAWEVIDGGASLIQLRDKTSPAAEFYANASVVRGVTRDRNIPLIINDRLDIAMAVGADGVHVGQEDLPLEPICDLAPEMWIGLSVSAVEELPESVEPDYYGVGALFNTGSKQVPHIPGLPLVRAVRERTRKPIIGIGGIGESNAVEAVRSGCDGLAVISAVLAGDDAEQATRKLKRLIDGAKTGT
jgi:thiamine-phosphate pyrophosphorylase